MNLIATYLKLRHSELLNHLMENGFSFDQADYFLPAANDSLITAFNQAGDCNNIEAGKVLANINVGNLARDTGIEANLINTALQSLIPHITNNACTEGLSELMSHLKRIF